MAMLDGIRIVDMTTVIFGPYATQMLADMGAEVIKVEAPGGDVSRYLGRARTTPDMGSVHLTVNRGKKSIVLDLKKEEDREAMRRLLETADVFFHNVRAEAITRLGFGREAVRTINPDIIHVHGCGFGQDGPYADLQAYDDVIQVATGTTSLLSRVDGDPRPRFLPSLIADKVSGLYGAQAILGAIIHKLRTGEGQDVEVPMYECFTSFMMCEHLRDATFEPPLGPAGYPRQMDPGRQPFPSKDGYVCIVPYTDDKLVSFLKLLGAGHLFDQPDYATQGARFANMTALYGEIAARTPTRTTAEWLEWCAENDFPAFAAYDLEDVRDDPHLNQTGFFRLREHPDSGLYREMRPPIRFSADQGREPGFAPKLGEHGDAIKQELGLG